MVSITCDSARTSVTTALMSMAMLSTLKVFFMTKKRARSTILSKGKKAAGELQIEDPEEEKGGVDSGMKGKKWNAATREVRPVLYAWTMAVLPHPVQAGGRTETERIIKIIDDRNIIVIVTVIADC
jgi:hypothetical protein